MATPGQTAIATPADNITEALNVKIAELKEMLLGQHPRMPGLLREIHSTLKQYPESVTILDEDQIGVIVNGLKKQTNTELATTALKSTNKKSLKSLDLADL